MTSGLAEPATAPSNLASVIEMGNGDLEAGFADAALVIERRYHTPTVHQGYIEPHACVGRWGQDDQAMPGAAPPGRLRRALHDSQGAGPARGFFESYSQ